ncbi:MAG TPA: hypothetical protein VIL71_23695 [Spirillospora sp.]
MDELLQRIQNDRQREANASASDKSGSYGSSLNDPLNDPLATGSFGSTGDSGGSAGSGGTGPWSTGGQSGGYDSGLGSGTPSGGLGSPSGFGQNQQSDGYPTAPAYGDTPRYDDPLGGGRDPLGGFGAGGESGSGVYGDFSGSSYGGGTDPLSAPQDPNSTSGYQDYGDPNATQAYGSGYFGGSQQGGYPQGGQQNDTGPYGTRQPNDDWENYRR